MAKRNEAGPEEIRCNIRQSCVFRRGSKGLLFLACESYLSKGCPGKGAGFETVSFADKEHMSTTAEASCTVNTQDLKRKYEQIKSDQLQEKPKMLLQKLSEAFVEKGQTEKAFWEPRADGGNLARNAPVGARVQEASPAKGQCPAAPRPEKGRSSCQARLAPCSQAFGCSSSAAAAGPPLCRGRGASWKA